MLRHNHVSENSESGCAPDSFQRGEKKIAANRVIEERLSLVAAERYEMKIACAIEALRMVGHILKLLKKVARRL